jgi:DNA polymerase-3 subunit epsilon/ATP-dependent DNA helicase DinG
MSTMVAIDTETTGFDPKKDAIIEIGAVKFNGKRVEAEWSTLINPNRPIPPEVMQLTGINNEMVHNAPVLSEVIQQLVDFVGDDPVLGQNVRFDLSFLQKHGILLNNDVADTYEMAAVLLPTASRYNLGSLAQNLGVPVFNVHRALDDARLTHAVYFKLYEKALQLPLDTIAEIVRLGEPLEWDGWWIFSQILRARSRQPIEAKHVGHQDYSALFGTMDILSQPLAPNRELEPLDVDEVAALLEHGGPFAKYFENFEQRPEQIEMLRSVARAFSQGQHLMVEAGTGTGKSFAYLIPAALWAMKNNTRVVISTNTINLQDQLIGKDIPDLPNALQLDLHAAVLKGRSNYLCPRRLDVLRQRGPDSAEAMRVLAKVMVWLLEKGSGDRSEINLNGPTEREVWSSRLSAEDEGCKTETCVGRMGGACPFYRARQAAQTAHIIVVNHALLLSDVVTGSRVLPDYDYLIVDEAHHLEDATTNALSFRLTEWDLSRLLRELGGTTSGALGSLLSTIRGLLRPSELAALEQNLKRATDLAFRLEHDFTQLLQSIDHFLEDRRDGQPVGNYGQQARIEPATRTLPVWSDVEIAWDSAHDTLASLISLITHVHKDAADMVDSAPDELEDALGNLGNIIHRFEEVNERLDQFVGKPDPNYVYWAELSPSNNNNRLAIEIAPLNIGPMMEEYLWHQKSSIVLTSATLTTGGEFNYLRNRLNADEANELVLGSPFDYENSALLYLVNDIPEPSDVAGHQHAVDRVLKQLSKATGGKLLALFTSYTQLKKTSKAIGPELAEAGIQVYEQGEGASANTLLETFRGAEKAVLLGTRAFWEGVDIPGQALSVLVIVKIPFDVPSDPIVAARSETFDDPFNEYSLPEAILRFRQGFGRLIRTQSDRGIVVVLDKRIISKRYGKSIIDSLPTCKLKIGALEDVPAIAKRWLNI